MKNLFRSFLGWKTLFANALFSSLLSLSSFGATRYVSKTGNSVSPYSSLENAATNIQSAIDVSSSGDIILVEEGRYTNGSSIWINKNINLKGAGLVKDVIIYGNNSGSCVSIANSGVIEGFTLTGGNANNGGGILFSKGGKASRCIISGNVAGSGGGVYCNRGGQLENCLIVNNSSTSYGGGVYGIKYKLDETGAIGGPVLKHCTIARNSSFYGGGVYFYLGGDMKNSLCISNSASYGENYHSEAYDVCGGSLEGNFYVGSFLNYTNNDFHLPYSSNLIDSCSSSLNVSNDLDNIPRPLDGNSDFVLKNDVGCYEFASENVDFDGDGFSDRQEWIAGTEIKDSSDFFRLLVRYGDNQAEIYLNGLRGREYYIDFRDLFPTSNWQEIDSFYGRGLTNSLSYTNFSRGLFRARVIRR